MLVLAIINGTVRDLGYKKYVDELVAHQISTITLLILFSIYMSFIVKKYSPHSGNQAILLGLFWMTLTLFFEFGFGKYRGNSWEKLLAEYDILKGRIWILIPIALASGPYIFFKLTKHI